MNANVAYQRFDAQGRELAISRVRRTTNWVAAAAAAGTGALIGFAAHGGTHHAAGATATSPSVAGSSGRGVSPSGSGSSSSPSPHPGGGALSGPSLTPTPTFQAPQAVTGQT